MFLKIGSWTISNELFDLRHFRGATELLLRPEWFAESIDEPPDPVAQPSTVGRPVGADGEAMPWCGRLATGTSHDD